MSTAHKSKVFVRRPVTERIVKHLHPEVIKYFEECAILEVTPAGNKVYTPCEQIGVSGDLQIVTETMEEREGYFLNQEQLDEYAKQEAIGFFIWYGAKMVTFIEYIKNIRPLVISKEIEEKIVEFEGKTFDELYNLYLKSKTP